MSVEGIRAVIRRHTGLHPKEPGKFPHSEVQEMIKSALDRGRITSLERAELLAVLAMFGGNSIHPHPFLAPGDIDAIKQTALSGIESVAGFKQLSKAEIANFLYYCVEIGSADLVGFTSVATPLNQLGSEVQTFINQVTDANLSKAGADKYLPADSVTPEVVQRNNEVYGYIVNASFPARVGGGWFFVLDVVGPDADFYREINGHFEPPDTDG